MPQVDSLRKWVDTETRLGNPALEMIVTETADAFVVSATPNEALIREWQEHAIDGYVKVIAGQEMGNKKEHLVGVATG